MDKGEASRQLAKIEAVDQFLASNPPPQDVDEVRRRAAALATYYRRQEAFEELCASAYAKLQCERWLGRYDEARKRHQGKRTDLELPSDRKEVDPPLTTEGTLHRWREMAKPSLSKFKDWFQRTVASTLEPTSYALYRWAISLLPHKEPPTTYWDAMVPAQKFQVSGTDSDNALVNARRQVTVEIQQQRDSPLLIPHDGHASKELIIARYNASGYPPLMLNQGWIYGVWYTPTSFQKQNYYGGFPLTFVKRIKSMFPTERMLHLCCGKTHIEGAVNVDIKKMPGVDIVANAEDLSQFKPKSFDVCLIDPPYSEEDASRYGVPRLIRPKKVMSEIRRVLIPGGWLLWLDEKYPPYRKDEWDVEGLIGVVTAPGRRARILAMYRKEGVK